MGLLQKLKSALGLDASGSPSAGANAPQDVDVTVEREPSTESEAAVKGTETEPAEESSEDESAVSETTESEAATETAESDEEAAPPTESDAPVTEIKGVGPAYAQRLEEVGVSTVSDLAVADPDELAEATDLSPNRISGWIDQAKSF